MYSMTSQFFFVNKYYFRTATNLVLECTTMTAHMIMKMVHTEVGNDDDAKKKRLVEVY